MSSDTKFRLAVSIAAVVFLVTGAAWVMKTGGGMCGNEAVKETLSPSGRWKVDIYERSCGATTPYVTNVRVLKANEKLGDDAGNVAVPARAWSIEWTSDQEVVVWYSRFYPPSTRTDRVGSVRVTYRQLP